MNFIHKFMALPHPYFVLSEIVIVIFFAIRKYFVGGTFVSSHVIEEDGNFYIYIVHEYILLPSINKFGLSLYSTHKIRKFNLKDKKYIFKRIINEQKIIGSNEEFLFLRNNRKLYFLDHKKGKIRTITKKKIRKTNPRLPEFRMRDINYNNNLQSLILRDIREYIYTIDYKTLKTKRADVSKINKFRKNATNKIYNYPNVWLEKWELLTTFYEYGSGRVKAIEDNKSSNYHIIFKGYKPPKNQKEEYDKKKSKGYIDVFYNPKFLNFSDTKPPLFSTKPPSVLIAHSTNLKRLKQKQVFITRVGFFSEKIWELSVHEIVPRFKKCIELFYFEINKKIYFMAFGYYMKFTNRYQKHKIAITIINKETGEIIEKAKYFPNSIFS